METENETGIINCDFGTIWITTFALSIQQDS